MNILFLEGDMSRKGGTERMTALLANALVQRHSVWVLSLKLEQGQVFFELSDQVHHETMPDCSGKLGILRRISRIRTFIRENHIDWVINVDTGMSIYGIPGAWGTDAKVITWEHANFHNNWGSRSFPAIRRFAARRSDAMVVLTRQDQQAFAEHIPSKVPVYAIANPAERHEFKYDEASKTILSAGALLPIKGYDRAIEVAKLVLPDRPGWTWIICGEGPEREKLEVLIRDAGLEGRVLLPGTVTDMENRYRNAAMVVMTSHMEGLPMVLLEAKSYGLPIVSFDITTGPRDIIAQGENGWLVPENDVSALAEKIALLMDHDQMRREFSRNSQKDMERFDFESILRQWQNVLEE